MRHTAKIQAFGFWGRSSPVPVSLDTNAFRAFVAAVRAPDARSCFGVQLLGDVNMTARNPREESATPFTLAYGIVAPQRFAQKNNWSVTEGEAAQVEEMRYAACFAGGLPALSYANNAADAPLSIFALLFDGSDQGWALPGLWLHQPSEQNPFPVFSANWGEVAREQGWQFRVADGRASIVRLAPTWTQNDENALHQLLGQDRQDTGQNVDQQAVERQIEQLRLKLYAGEWALNGGSAVYNRALSLHVVPDYNAFHVFFNGERTRIEAKPLSARPAPSNDTGEAAPHLWGAGRFTLRSNGGGFIWQTGYPQFSGAGEAPLGTPLGFYNSPEELALSDITPRVVAHAPSGTSVRLVRRHVRNANGEEMRRVQMVARLETSNRRVAPLVYALGMDLRGGARTGSMTQVFDSSALPGRETGDYRVGAEPQPILDVVPQFNGENQRRQYIVYMRDVNGRTFAHLTGATNDVGANAEVLENRVVTLSIDGHVVLTEGLVVSARHAKLSSMMPTAVRELMARGESIAELTVCDGWALLEERRGRGETGDGGYKGAYVRRLLQNCGFKAWQLGGVPERAGGRFDPVAPGESYKIVCEPRDTYASKLHDVLRDNLPGWTLYQDGAGVWQLKRRDKTVKAEFSSRADRNTPNAYPGRYAILDELVMVRDTSDFYNVHSAEVKSANGETTLVEYALEESIQAPLGPTPRSHIGREREAPPLSGARDETTANLNLRFAVEDQGLPRFGDFSTYFHRDLWPGDYVRCDGLLCRIARIPHGSIADDSMTLGVREV